MSSEALAVVTESLATRVGLHPFLCGMSRPHLELLTGCAMETTFLAGEFIFHQGDCANRFYLIETGKVALQSTTQDEPLVIETVGPGGLIGWSWLFPPYVWFFDAVAKEETRALFFYGTILREYCEKDSSLGYALFKRMSQVMVARLQAARGKLVAG